MTATAFAGVREAKELLDPSHPLHQTFARWVAKRAASATSGAVVQGSGANLTTAEVGALTARQARKFLAVPAHARYRAQPEPKAKAEQPKAKGKRWRRGGKQAEDRLHRKPAA